MKSKSKRFQLDSVDWEKVGRDFVIAYWLPIGYVFAQLSQGNFVDWKIVATGIAGVTGNIIYRWAKNNKPLSDNK